MNEKNDGGKGVLSKISCWAENNLYYLLCFSLNIGKRTDTLGKSADYKTLKKLEKEEKEFRKKFKVTF